MAKKAARHERLSSAPSSAARFWGVLAELVVDPKTNRRRISTLSGQAVPEGLFIECSKRIREQHPIGTIFKVDVCVSRKPVGRPYLHSLRKQELLTEEQWKSTYGGSDINR